jgi:hypothetical protein
MSFFGTLLLSEKQLSGLPETWCAFVLFVSSGLAVVVVSDK